MTRLVNFYLDWQDLTAFLARVTAIYIIAGPNGVGKTTFANSSLPTFAKCREFLNADLIAAGLSPYDPESQAFRASELLLRRIDELVDSRSSFSFETTLAARSYRKSISHWKKLGYQVFLIYLWLPSADRTGLRLLSPFYGFPRSSKPKT